MKVRKKWDILMLNCKDSENVFITNIIYLWNFELFHYEEVYCWKQFEVNLIGSDR
jgi:hypothetical protein